MFTHVNIRAYDFENKTSRFWNYDIVYLIRIINSILI